MNAHHTNRPDRFWFLSLAALLAIAALTVKSSRGTQAANADSLAATYSPGILNVTIPYDLSRA
jgi:hypothetical protein